MSGLLTEESGRRCCVSKSRADVALCSALSNKAANGPAGAALKTCARPESCRRTFHAHIRPSRYHNAPDYLCGSSCAMDITSVTSLAIAGISIASVATTLNALNAVQKRAKGRSVRRALREGYGLECFDPPSRSPEIE